MNNLHLFELINAAPGMGRLQLLGATALANGLIWLVPLALTLAWVRGSRSARLELLHAVLAVGLALGLAQIVAQLWPQPRPFVLHLGTQYLEHSADPGLPSDHVVVFWSLALALLRSRTFGMWGFPTLALGLLVGWSRVYLGVHFPLDVLAALPVAWAATMLAHALHRPLFPLYEWVLRCHDRLARRLRPGVDPPRKA